MWLSATSQTAPTALFLLISSTWLCSFCTALDNGLALAPPMGWNSWNTFHCDISQDLIVQTARTIKNLELDKLGYVHVNLDDCWMAKFRTLHGKLIGEEKRFPNGMKWIGDYLHSLGLKFGIYSSAGIRTCAGYPASLGHEVVDATSFAEWGVDYLKYDNCFNLAKPSIDRYSAMRNALNATGRPILFSICQWGTEDSWQWGPSMGNTWRTTGDIDSHWGSIKGCFWRSQQHFERSQPGAWLDPDMLEVGNGDLTLAENRAHFTLWALAKAPLLLGNDLNKMPESILDIISNKNLIEIHQDPKTPQATCVVGCDKQNWCAPNVDGEHVSSEDTYVCDHQKLLSPTVDVDEDGNDYSVFATRRGSNDIVVALIVNWHDKQTLQLGTMNAVQLLGVAPLPAERGHRVLVHDLWSDKYLTPPGGGHDDEYFDFDTLKEVPIPPIAPHDCFVLSFSTFNQNQQKVEQ